MKPRYPSNPSEHRQNMLNMDPLGDLAIDCWYSSMRMSVHVPAPSYPSLPGSNRNTFVWYLSSVDL